MRKFEEEFEDLFVLYQKYDDLIEGQLRTYAGIPLFPAEIHLLVFIEKHKDLNITEMAAKKKVTKGALSKTIGKLEKKGLITKFQKKGNSKNIFLALTDNGMNAYKAHEKFHNEHDTIFSNEMHDFFKKNEDIIRKALDFAKTSIQFYIDEVEQNPNKDY